MKRLAIITTHPIQYYAPLFRLLNERKNISIRVFYTWEKKAASFDRDFKRVVEWDIPLLEGYDHQFVSNEGSLRTDFRGVKNPGLIREIEEWGAEAILVFGWNYYSHLKAMRYFSNRIPVFFRGDSTLLDEVPGLKKIVRRIFLRWVVYRQVDLALYVGENNKNYFLANGLQEDQLVFVPHAIDNARFSDRDGKHEAQAQKRRKEFGIKEKDITFVFVGKFQAKKDPLLLIRAFQQVDNARTHLLLVGDGILEQLLKTEAGENRNIHFLPFQNQSYMPVIYRIGDIFCLPSGGPGETWGLAVNEAMACGRPVLVSDHCGCAADLVINGRNGYSFISGDQDDLVEKMRNLLGNDLALKEMAAASQKIIEEWSFDRATAAIEKVTSEYA
jgi:glycosyltransferase involved in cell wall biosynthesis